MPVPISRTKSKDSHATEGRFGKHITHGQHSASSAEQFNKQKIDEILHIHDEEEKETRARRHGAAANNSERAVGRVLDAVAVLTHGAQGSPSSDLNLSGANPSNPPMERASLKTRYTETQAVALLQRTMSKKVHKRTSLARLPLIERVELELALFRGLRVLFLCMFMFLLVIYAAILEGRSQQKLGLVNTYAGVFGLDAENLMGLTTRAAFFDFIVELSEAARRLQPASSAYFVEETGEIQIMKGIRKFSVASTVKVAGLDPRIDSPSFSIMAWITLKKGKGGNILRKPLGQVPAQIGLSCWAWSVGSPRDRFDFGAHDFRGGTFEEELQETVDTGVNSSSSVDDGKLHNVAVVVNQESLSFFTDAKLQARIMLQRPITDCTGSTLEIGDVDIPALGEITFFPREITTTEMEEKMDLGHTSGSIAAGKLAFEPEMTEFDAIGAQQATAFAQAKGERSLAATNMAVEATINRLVTESTRVSQDDTSVEKIVVPQSPSCPSIATFVSSAEDATSCHLLHIWNESSIDTQNPGRTYYNLVQPPYRSGKQGRDRMMLDHNYARQQLNYNASTFPSFCGMSATFTMWIENWDCGPRTALIARYPTADSRRDPGAWFYQIDQSPIGTKICVGQIPASGSVAFWKCVQTVVKFNCMAPKTRRHLAVAFDHMANTITFYVDGLLLGVTSSQEPANDVWIADSMGGGVGRMDCGMGKGYTALGHRVPNQQPYVGPIQDWRYYRGYALDPSEIKMIALGTIRTDSSGQTENLRTCEFSSEGGDSKFKDIYGRDCAWYQEQRQAVPRICATNTVRDNCPVACGSKFACTQELLINKYSIWERQMPIMEYDSTLGTNGDSICVRQGVDVVAQCRANLKILATSRTPVLMVGSTDYSVTLPNAGGSGNGNLFLTHAHTHTHTFCLSASLLLSLSLSVSLPLFLFPPLSLSLSR